MIKAFLLLITTFLTAISTYATLSCSKIFTNEGFRDSSVELELPLSVNTVELLTTTSGTLKELFHKDSNVPTDIYSYILSKNRLNSVLDFPLQNLPQKLRVKALKEGIIYKNLQFGDSRNNGRAIPGLIVKPEYQKKFNLAEKVELGSPETLINGELLEFHVRSSQRPGDLSVFAANIPKSLGYQSGSMHMHVLFESMLSWIKENPSVNSWRFIEFWRRLNLAMEMREVVEKGAGIIFNTHTINNQTYRTFSPLTYSEITSGFNYFYGKAHNNKVISSTKFLGSKSKMGWVGLWGHDKYDDSNLFGFEFRFLDGSNLTPGLIKYLNQVHTQVESKNFGLSEDEFLIWMDYIKINSVYTDESEFPSLNLYQVVRNQMAGVPNTIPWKFYTAISPHRDFSELYKNLPFDIKRILMGIDKEKLNNAFNDRGSLRYLIHDWSRDPILYGKTELIDKIRTAQLTATRKWARGENETQVIQQFLIYSGLYFEFASSINFEP